MLHLPAGTDPSSISESGVTFSKILSRDEVRSDDAKDVYSAIYSGTCTSSCGTSVTVYYPQTENVDIYLFDVNGILASTSNIGNGTCPSSCSSSIYFSSTPFTESAYFAIAQYGYNNGAYPFTAGSSFTVFTNGGQYGRGEYSTTVSSATTFPASTATPTDAWVGVGAIFPASVTKPLTCTVANGGTEGTLTVSGGYVSPTTLVCDGSAHDFTALSSSTLTLTVPIDGSNTRYRFSGGTTTATVSTCGSGTCSGASGTVYYQLQNTFDAKPKLPTIWDHTGTDDIAAAGTVSGSGSTTICSMSTTSGRTGTVHCAGWSDYDQAVALGTLAVGSTERWVPSTNTESVTTTTGGNNYTSYGHYARQWQVQWAVSPGGDGSTSPSATAFYNDTSSVSISASADSGYVFDYWSASSGSITFGSFSSPSTEATIGAAGTITANFRQYVQPLNNPSDFVNLTGSEPSVYVSLFNQTDNDLAGGSCSGPPCTPSLGGYSFQFNVVFPEFLVHNYTYIMDDHLVYDEYDYCGNASSVNYTADHKPSCVPFMMQATIEFYANDTCKAVPQGAPSSNPAPK